MLLSSAAQSPSELDESEQALAVDSSLGSDADDSEETEEAEDSPDPPEPPEESLEA